MIQTNPYLFFKGNCREAMGFYKSIFGGELTITTYGDANAVHEDTPAEYLMHASLSGGEINLMASDTSQASEKAAKISISLSGDEEPKLTDIFNRLSQDVDVQYPLKKESWGDVFGSVTDKYGIDWLVNISASKQ
jgi:PhnB protein